MRKPFQKLERIAFHDLAVFEGARLGFICIGNHIMRPVLVINEGPLHAGGEACAAAPAQAGILDHIGHLGGRHFGDRVLEGCKATVLFVDIERIDIRDIAMAEEDVVPLLHLPARSLQVPRSIPSFDPQSYSRDI